MHDADDLTAFQIVGHGGGHQIDLTLGKELHAIGGVDGHEFDLDAYRLGDVTPITEKRL